MDKYDRAQAIRTLFANQAIIRQLAEEIAKLKDTDQKKRANMMVTLVKENSQLRREFNL